VAQLDVDEDDLGSGVAVLRDRPEQAPLGDPRLRDVASVDHPGDPERFAPDGLGWLTVLVERPRWGSASESGRKVDRQITTENVRR